MTLKSNFDSSVKVIENCKDNNLGLLHNHHLLLNLVNLVLSGFIQHLLCRLISCSGSLQHVLLKGQELIHQLLFVLLTDVKSIVYFKVDLVTFRLLDFLFLQKLDDFARVVEL